MAEPNPEYRASSDWGLFEVDETLPASLILKAERQVLGEIESASPWSRPG